MQLLSRGGARRHSPLSLSLRVCGCRGPRTLSAAPHPFPRGSHCLSQCARASQRGERRHVMQLPSHEEACCHSPLSLSLCVCVAAEARGLSLLLRTRFLAALPVSLSLHSPR